MEELERIVKALVDYCNTKDNKHCKISVSVTNDGDGEVTIVHTSPAIAIEMIRVSKSKVIDTEMI